MTAQEMELYVKIRASLLGSGLPEARKQIKELGEEGVKTGKDGVKGFNNILRSVGETRRGVARLGFIWAATFGAGIAARSAGTGNTANGT